MEHELNGLIALGATAWFLFIIWGLYLLFITIAVPWFIYKIRLDVKDSKELLIEIYRNLSSETPSEQIETPADSPEISIQQTAEESPAIDPETRKNPEAREVSNQNKDDDLKYAPPGYRK